jgi:hypothetical protein
VRRLQFPRAKNWNSFWPSFSPLETFWTTGNEVETPMVIYFSFISFSSKRKLPIHSLISDSSSKIHKFTFRLHRSLARQDTGRSVFDKGGTQSYALHCWACWKVRLFGFEFMFNRCDDDSRKFPDLLRLKREISAVYEASRIKYFCWTYKYNL